MRIIIFSLLIIKGLFVVAMTDTVKMEIISKDTTKIKVMGIFPDSFPDISVIFKAESNSGKPIWNLEKESVTVLENKQICKTISLDQISKNKSIIIGLVVDHSGSMSFDSTGYFDAIWNYIKNNQNNDSLKTFEYLSPMANAKLAINTFASSFNLAKDYMAVVGFSDSVDLLLPISQNIESINSAVHSLKADSKTALYDAIISALDLIDKADDGVRIVVALTDGNDNSSKHTKYDVIEKAMRLRIPISIIGVGDLNYNDLCLIADSTHGDFYPIKTSNSLKDLYSSLSTKIQAYYDLKYFSKNMSSTDSTRTLEFNIEVDSFFLYTNPISLNLPQEVKDVLEMKKKNRIFLLFGAIAILVLLGTGSILFFYKKIK